MGLENTFSEFEPSPSMVKAHTDRFVKIENEISEINKINTNHSERIRSTEESTKSAHHRIDKKELEIDEIKKTHSILLSFETKMENIDKKVERQIEQSREDTKTITNALIANKPTLQDKIIDAIIPLMVNGSLLGGLYLLLK